MSTVIVTVATTPANFPPATVPAGIVVTLSGGAVPAQTVQAPYSASFADVPAGNYTASAQAVDASGNPLGAPAVSAEFTVSPDVSVDVPQTVTVTVQ